LLAARAATAIENKNQRKKTIMDESSFIGPGTDLGLNDAQSDAFAEIISERSGGNHIGIIRELRKKNIDSSAIRSRTYQLAGNRRGRGLASRRPRKLGEVTIVIPVLNESRRISSVVKFGLSSRLVKEVLVIDDGSIDGTPELAEAAGARVITSSILGKGGSMEDGLVNATTETILYLDGDLHDLSEDLVDRMCRPILNGEADFTKARFSRKSGRVTILTAKPLLHTYFPEVAHFQQPLGGIIAARTDLLRKVHFENDYGVDIGLLLDAVALGARIAEIDIGHIDHESQDLERLGEMATQVARAILDRAAMYGRLKRSFVRSAREKENFLRSDPEFVVSRVGAVDRLAVFDMDGTLLDGRFIMELAKVTGRADKLAKYMDRYDLTPEKRARKIARIFAGVPAEVFVKTAMSIPLAAGAVAAVVGLRKLGYRVGIVTDSYQIAAEIARKRVFADFALSNVVEFSKGRATGNVTLAPSMRDGAVGWRAYDKLNAIRFLTKRMGISARQVLAVGDGENDCGMLRAAGISIAFQPKSERLRRIAKHVIHKSLDQLLDFVPVDKDK
jgi:glucosyl-3-phosphoglycerate synthase